MNPAVDRVNRILVRLGYAPTVLGGDFGEELEKVAAALEELSRRCLPDDLDHVYHDRRPK